MSVARLLCLDVAKVLASLEQLQKSKMPRLAGAFLYVATRKAAMPEPLRIPAGQLLELPETLQVQARSPE